MKLVLAIATTAITGLARATVVDWASFGDGSGPFLVGGDITVTATAVGGGSGLVSWIQTPDFVGATGLGVVGGGDDKSLDLDGEILSFDFGELVDGVVFGIWDIDPPGNVNFAFEAFDTGASLGVFDVPPTVNQPEYIDFTALAGGRLFDRVDIFIVSTLATRGLLITSTEYTIVPSGGATTAIAFAATALLRRRR